MEFRFEGLTLANLAGGKLEAQFQEALASIVDVDADADRYQQDKEGNVAMAVEIRLAVSINAQTKTRALVATCHVKHPKRKAVGNVFHVQSGAVLIQPELEAMPLPFGDSDGVARLDDARSAKGEKA